MTRLGHFSTLLAIHLVSNAEIHVIKIFSISRLHFKTIHNYKKKTIHVYIYLKVTSLVTIYNLYNMECAYHSFKWQIFNIMHPILNKQKFVKHLKIKDKHSNPKNNPNILLTQI